MTIEDLWSLARVGAPRPAPGGRRALVPVATFDMETNKGRTRLWMVSADGHEPWPLTAPDVSSDQPAFSPDGHSIVFVRRKEGEKPQLYRMSLDGGEAERLTDLPLGLFDPKWLPDGRHVVFAAPVIMTPESAGASSRPAAPAPSAPPAPAEPESVARTRRLAAAREAEPVKARVTEDRVYRYWDKWLTGGEAPHLFLLDLTTKRLLDLTPELTAWFDFDDPGGQYDVAPDGGEIAFSANASRPPHHQLKWEIFTLPLTRDGSGAVTAGPVRSITGGNSANDLKPRYSPDGRWLLYGMQVDPFFYADKVRLVRVDRAGGGQTVLTEAWDRSAAAWEFDRSGARLLIVAENEATTALFSTTLEPGATPGLLVPGGTVGGPAVADDGRVWFAYQDLSHPPEVRTLAPGATAPETVTRFNDEKLAAIEMGRVEERHFAGAGGARVQMFVVYPPGFDPGKKWPLVHVIHGGPHGISGDQFHWRWNAQLFAAPGYVVVMVNFHGSTSFGQEFARSIVGNHPDGPFADVMAATDELLKLDFLDPKRMAATGGSYGGYLVTWIAGHTDRFRCLVNHAGVYDLHSQYASDVTQGRSHAYGGEPWEGIERIDRASPNRYAAGFVTPMLILHGDLDYRVPHTQGLEIYGVYRAKGVPARLVSYPDENHWILSPRNSRHWYGEVHGWLARFLKGRTAARSATRPPRRQER